MAGILTNPIAYAHVKSNGGWPRLTFIAIAYAAVIMVLIGISSYTPRRWDMRALGAWIYILLWIQAILLLLVGNSRITTAIQRDLKDRMIDSHRLMPLPPSQAILGYIAGGAAQVMPVFLANLIMGLAICFISGGPVNPWLTSNLVLVLFSLFIYTFVAMLAFMMRGATAVVTASLSITGAMQGIPALILPGLAVLLTPMVGESLFELRREIWDFSPTLLIASVAHLAMGWVFFLGACRKYRRDNQPALSVLLGLALLAAWELTSITGFAYMEQFRPRFGMGGRPEEEVKIIATLTLSLLLAMLPVSTAVQESFTARPGRKTVPAAGTALLAALLSAGLVLFRPEPSGHYPFPEAALGTVSLMCVYLLFYRYLNGIGWQFFPRRRRIVVITIVLLTLTVPLVADAVRNAWDDSYTDELSVIGTISPIGALVGLWGDVRVNVLPAIVTYAVLAGVLGMQFHARRRKIPLQNASG